MDQDDVVMATRCNDEPTNGTPIISRTHQITEQEQQQPLLCLSPQSASKVGKITNSMTDFMIPVKEETPSRRPLLDQMV